MGMTVKIEADRLEEAIEEILKDYAGDVTEALNASVKAVARQTTSELRQVSPGEYAKHWRHKAEKARLGISETVYNEEAYLSHLLEHEHDVGNVGHYPARQGSATDHTGKIAAVDRKIPDRLLSELEKKL